MAKLQNENLELENFVQLRKKAVDTEIKADLEPISVRQPFRFHNCRQHLGLKKQSC